MKAFIEKVIFVIVIAMSIVYAQNASATLRLVDLSELVEGTSSNAKGINDVGQIVIAYDGHELIWQDGVMTEPGTLAGEDFTFSTSINNLGQLSGYSSIFGNTCCQAALWQDNEWVALGMLPGDTYSKAYDINDSGQIVGESVSPLGLRRAFIWQGGEMTSLGTLGGISHSFATGINNNGDVVGSASTSDGFYHAFLWQNGAMTDLGTLGGSYSYALGINDYGEVVGRSFTSSGATHAFLWRNGVMTDLGTLGEHSLYPELSEANAINNAGQVVGYSGTSTPTIKHAFKWQNGVMTDLGSLGGYMTTAVAINDAGEVVGYSALPSGTYHAILWTSKPLITASAGSGGSISPSGNVVVTSGTDKTFIITADNGYHVADVIINGVSVGAVTSYTFSNVTTDNTISVLFSINPINPTIIAKAGWGGGISPSGSITINHGTDQSFHITPAIGYDIGCVIVDDKSVGAVTSYTFTNVTADHYISVSFVRRTFYIDARASSGGYIWPSYAVVSYGDAKTFFITPWNKYYRISDVTVDGASVGAVTQYIFNNVTAGHTIEAEFIPVNIAVTSPNGGEIWDVGTTQTIEWSYIDDPGNVVSIELLKGGSLFAKINPGVAIEKNGSGSYKWHLQNKLPPGNDYKIRITSKTNETFSDSSDSTFIIQ